MNSTPHIFDTALRRKRRERAAKRCAKTGAAFFTRRCAEDTADRLQDIARQFEQALIIAPPEFWPLVCAQLPESKIPKNVIFCYDAADAQSCDAKPAIAAKDDALPFKANSFDLVISILNLHGVNDVPGALSNIAHVLRPDGLMLSAVFGGATLSQLRQSFYRIESAQHGGLSPRVAPMIDFSQCAALLQRAAFALPVVDTDRFTLSYDALAKLTADLRDSAQTNTMVERGRAPLSASFMRALETDLMASSPAKTSARTKTSTGDKHAPRFEITFEILWMTGWSPHKDQQKPLKPGSAKMRLAEALGVKEQKL